MKKIILYEGEQLSLLNYTPKPVENPLPEYPVPNWTRNVEAAQSWWLSKSEYCLKMMRKFSEGNAPLHVKRTEIARLMAMREKCLRNLEVDNG